ncbi:GNAT family N-acetyltransferase [Hoeflea sp. AS60]|uniref:GNAT family N-acetyltransferase n=1 Tax=Hoeflea sp. AS60 TaxID=3135780 RepID=UPI003181C910
MTIEMTVIEGGDEEFANTVEFMIDSVAEKLGKPFDPEPFHLRASDADGQLVGGLAAHKVQGWLFIKLLGIAEGQRGNGIGRTLLSRAESFARREGLVGVYLDTFEFQAPRFYEAQGYTECGRLPASGGAPQRIWFAKTFDDADAGKN